MMQAFHNHAYSRRQMCRRKRERLHMLKVALVNAVQALQTPRCHYADLYRKWAQRDYQRAADLHCPCCSDDDTTQRLHILAATQLPSIRARENG